MKRALMVVFILLVSVVLLSGCKTLTTCNKPVPVPVKNAAIGMNFIKGKIAFVGQDGKPVTPTSFTERVKRRNEQEGKWNLDTVMNITIYRVKGSEQIWYYIDNQLYCFEYEVQGNGEWRYKGACP